MQLRSLRAYPSLPRVLDVDLEEEESKEELNGAENIRMEPKGDERKRCPLFDGATVIIRVDLCGAL